MESSGSSRVSLRRWIAGGLFLVILPAVGFWALSGKGWGPGTPSTSLTSLKSPYKNTRPEVKYVGDEACARCHAEISRSYHRHSMGRSVAPANAADTPGLDPKTGRAEFTSGGLTYAVERRDGGIVHSEAKKDEQGREVTRVEAKVTYAVGSGHRGISYLIERDGFLFQSPISWYSQQGRWDLSPDSLAKNHHFERPIDPSCLFCHVNRFEPIETTMNRYRPPTFQGMTIGCERCHGPGELHVKSPGTLTDGQDLTIVNPAHLEPSLREAVCQQCHLGGRSRVERPGRKALDYRPGLPLHEFLTILVDRERPMGSTKSISHVEQMRSSRCYRATKGQLGCISCHDPHFLPAAAESAAYYRGRCLECHGSGTGCGLPEPARREQSRDDNCVQCHMPRSKLANVAHTAETDHGIPRRGNQAELPPIIAASTGRDESPLVPFHLDLVEPEKRSELDRDIGIALAGAAAEQGPAGARLARIALPLLDAVLKARPHDLVAWQAKAVALSLRNRPREALVAAEAALAIAPNNERSLAHAIPLLAGQGRREECLALGWRLLAVAPWISEYHVIMARLHAQGNEWPQSADACRAALRLDPTNLTARWILIKAAVEMRDWPVVRSEGQTYLKFDLSDEDRGIVQRWIDQAR